MRHSTPYGVLAQRLPLETSGGWATPKPCKMQPAAREAVTVSRVNPPFRADHVGSLLRPQRLKEARERCQKGDITRDELRAVEDDAIREVVSKQEAIGLQSITDGEFRRTFFHIDFL